MKKQSQLNQNKEVVKFLKRMICFLIVPVLLTIGTYIYLDPFKVIYDYDIYYDENNKNKGGVVLNSGYVNTMTLSQQIDSIKYNSFIFGNSRSGFYEVNDWKNYLTSDARCFHLDAAMETYDGLCKKIKYLDEIGVKIENALIVLDYSIFIEKKHSSHLFIQPPILNKNSIIYNIIFQWNNFRAFCNPHFIKAYLGHYYIGKDMDDANALNKIVFEYDVMSSELKQIESEQKIKDGIFYDAERMLFFLFNKQYPDSIGPQYIDEDIKQNLVDLKQILDKHNTDYRVVISPLYNQIKFNSMDLIVLKSIFGNEFVYDFSGANEFTSDFQNYYEDSHYRPHVAREIMKIIYN